MQIKVLRAKIHLATVTETRLDYEGSITLDEDLMEAVGLVPGEAVLVSNLANGSRQVTYVIPGERGSGASLGSTRTNPVAPVRWGRSIGSTPPEVTSRTAKTRRPQPRSERTRPTSSEARPRQVTLRRRLVPTSQTIRSPAG